MKHTFGFTILELLVVIAIVAILAASLIAFLMSARSRAKDANLQTLMGTVANDVELYFSEHKTLAADPLGLDPNIPDDICEALGRLQSSAFPLIDPSTNPQFADCEYRGAVWAVELSLNSGAYWCVDSEGYRGESKPTGVRVGSGNPPSTACDRL